MRIAKKIRKTNKSGHLHIYKKNNLWYFQKFINKKMYRECFKTLDEAINHRDIFMSIISHGVPIDHCFKFLPKRIAPNAKAPLPKLTISLIDITLCF